MLTTGSEIEEINKLKKHMSSNFEMQDLGVAKQILKMRISKNAKMGTLQLYQQEYNHKVLDWFGIKDAKLVKTPVG